MKNLYLITRRDAKKDSFELLESSAKKKGISVNTIFTEDFDFSKSLKLTSDDGLYNICDDITSQIIEKSVINSKVQSFYTDYRHCINKINDIDDIRSYLIHKNNNLPVIKSILSLTTDKKMLKKYVDHLDGFPIIIKSMGGSHGIGVMKVDSLDSLYSIVDYLTKQKDNFILRKFINYKKHARFIVLRDKVIASIEYKKIKGDFRSNVGENLNIISRNFGTLYEKIAVDSVHTLGYEFGGVDMLIDRDNRPYIAEINFPCYFPRAQQATGIDISGKMIDYLIEKSKNKMTIK